MPGDSYSSLPDSVAPEAMLPPPVLLFLRLCFVAGLFNDFLLFAVVLLNPHQTHAELAALQRDPHSNIFAMRLGAGFILGAVMAPIVLLPYWLGLAVVYARNMWAQGSLYFGAAVYIMVTMGAGLRHGLLGLDTLGLLMETILGVAVLIALVQAPVQDWLRCTVPGFASRNLRY